MRYPIAKINVNSLKNNIQVLKKLKPQNRILAVLKANAYGHDLPTLANLIEKDIDAIGIARIEEGLILRNQKIQTQLVCLEGFCGESELLLANEYNIDCVIHCFEQVEAMEKLAQQLKSTSVWLKFNTGMNRLGFDYDELLEAKQRLETLSCVTGITFISHLARADEEAEKEFTQQQFAKFDQLRQKFPDYDYSFCASSGILFHQAQANDWIRPGITIYGISPNPAYKIDNFGFKNVLNFETVLIAKHQRKVGDFIGYGNSYEVKEPGMYGVIGLGYGDGYPRLAAGTPIYINGRLCPIVGRVSMDMTVVYLGKEASDQVGDRVVIFGDELPIEDVAGFMNISTYELSTSITARVYHDFIY